MRTKQVSTSDSRGLRGCKDDIRNPTQAHRLRLAGDAETIVIARDGYGVPHVRAGATTDAWFGQGYACAQDRLFQLDYDRRRACGRWAEIVGAPGIGVDVFARRLQLVTASRNDVSAMAPATRAAFEAYAKGINKAIADGATPLPGRYAVRALGALALGCGIRRFGTC